MGGCSATLGCLRFCVGRSYKETARENDTCEPTAYDTNRSTFSEQYSTSWTMRCRQGPDFVSWEGMDVKGVSDTSETSYWREAAHYQACHDRRDHLKACVGQGKIKKLLICKT